MPFTSPYTNFIFFIYIFNFKLPVTGDSAETAACLFLCLFPLNPLQREFRILSVWFLSLVLLYINKKNETIKSLWVLTA